MNAWAQPKGAMTMIARIIAIDSVDVTGFQV